MDWEVVPEFSFNVYGDRGSVDVLAWHPRERILLIIEVKATLTDLQNLVASMSKKGRVVPNAADDARGWQASHVAMLVAVAGTTANRSIVARHAATFGAAFPVRTRAVQTWLRNPRGPIHGIWFVAGDANASIARTSRSRVRRRQRNDFSSKGQRRATPS